MAERGYSGGQDRSEVGSPSQTGSASSSQTKRDEVASLLLEAQSQYGDYVAMLVGMRSQLESNGWTREQASAMVAYQFGWRPADGSKAEGVD